MIKTKNQNDEQDEKKTSKSFWQYKVDEAKEGQGWYFLIGDSILIRRIPYNFEVTTKKHSYCNYYGALEEAVSFAIQCLIEKKAARSHTAEELLELIKGIRKEIIDICKEVPKSVYAQLDAKPTVISTEDHPDGVDTDGKYFCTECNRKHKLHSGFGQRHIKFMKK